MELKLKLASILKPRDYSWRPSCTHSPKTLSFRASAFDSDHLFAALNSALADIPFSLSTNETASSSSEASSEGDIDEAAIRGAQSETARLLFDPTDAKSLLPVDEDKEGGCAFEERSVVVTTIESDDPYMDFRRSIEEVVVAHQGLLNDWEALEELLAWYLSTNSTHNHHYVVGAFVDVLLKFSSCLSHDDIGGLGGGGGRGQ